MNEPDWMKEEKMGAERTSCQGVPEEESWQMLELVFQHTHDCIVLLDKDFNFIQVNQAYADVCAREIGEFQGHNHFEFYPSPLIEDFRRVSETGIPFHAKDRPFVFPDHPEWGVTYWDLSLVPISGKDRQVNFLLFTLKDITENHRTLHALQRTNQALKAISLCNSLLIHASNEHELLEGMCKVVVEAGGYLMAWIGFAEQDENKTVKPVAQSGHEENYLTSIRISWGGQRVGAGPDRHRNSDRNNPGQPELSRKSQHASMAQCGYRARLPIEHRIAACLRRCDFRSIDDLRF